MMRGQASDRETARKNRPVKKQGRTKQEDHDRLDPRSNERGLYVKRLRRRRGLDAVLNSEDFTDAWWPRLHLGLPGHWGHIFEAVQDLSGGTLAS